MEYDKFSSGGYASGYCWAMINVRELSHCPVIDGLVIELLNLIFPLQGTMIIIISQDSGDRLMINGITRCFKDFLVEQ